MYKKHFSFTFLLFVLMFGITAKAQDTSKIYSLYDYTITVYKNEKLNSSSFVIMPLNIDSLSRRGNFHLTDMMARTPGVSMLSTGVGIAKPVIRGLYGNRVLVLLSGLKFDNQQWQEEHGLGLSDMGLSKVEIIKGPLGALYGSEAMGGVINLVEEQKPKYSEEGDASLRLNSNTGGGLLQAGYRMRKNNHWFRLRIGAENNADYTDGRNNRVLNSRFDGYYLKSSYGFTRKRLTSVNNFMSSFNRFGFIFNDVYTFVKPDSRWSRVLTENPAHFVLLNILSSDNTINLRNQGKLSINAGIQSNKRMENEGGGAISLNMHLLTFQYLIKLEKRLNKNNRLIISTLGSVEDNTNFGARKIVPDALMEESNISLYLESESGKKWRFENGAGVGQKYIKTFFTATVNSPDKEIHPFTKTSPYYNLFSGFSFQPDKHYRLKANVATGLRVPNLAELSSNGLHEGVFTYEIGSPLLKTEQNLMFNLMGSMDYKFFSMTVTPFFNHFENYVYLAPTTELWFGFPVYRYMQQDATQYGGECSVTARPLKAWQISATYSEMVSKTADGNYTPFIPARKISGQMDYTIKKTGTAGIQCFASADYCFAQNNTAPHEIATPDYLLLNAGAYTAISRGSNTYTFSLACNNMLNTAYYDHLSRFKYFGLLNIGRNFTASVKIAFHSIDKKN